MTILAPNGFKMFQPLTFSYTVRNVSGSSASIKRFVVPVLGPAGDGLGVDCANGSGVTLAAGQTFTCTASLPTGYGSPGTFTYWADWQGYDDRWHEGQLGGKKQFALAASERPAGCGSPIGSQTLVVVSPLSVSAPNGFKMFQPLTFSYTVCNVSGAPASIKRFVVPVLGPAGDGLGVDCANGSGVTLAAGQTFTCTATLTTGYGSPGTFTYWADWQGYDDGWHEGQLGGKQQLTLTQP